MIDRITNLVGSLKKSGKKNKKKSRRNTPDAFAVPKAPTLPTVLLLVINGGVLSHIIAACFVVLNPTGNASGSEENSSSDEEDGASIPSSCSQCGTIWAKHRRPVVTQYGGFHDVHYDF